LNGVGARRCKAGTILADVSNAPWRCTTGPRWHRGTQRYSQLVDIQKKDVAPPIDNVFGHLSRVVLRKVRRRAATAIWSIQ
jgi:hypothetical protein